MQTRLRTALVALTALLACTQADADDPKAIVQRGKRATALLVLPAGQGFGSAFCIDAAGFFVTNEHVVRGLPAGGKVALVLHPGEDGERVVRAVVVRADAEPDLALLKAEGAKDLTALELGGVDDLVETASLTAFGYPFGDRLAVRDKKYPNVSVNVGRVTSLRRARQRLEAIQLDAALNPGNSGGPVLDAGGRVVGIVRAGIGGSGVNFAIPVTRLEELLTKPEIVFDPPAIPDARKSEAHVFTIRLVSFRKPAPQSSVELTLTAGGADRKLAATPGEGDTYTVSAAPVPKKDGPRQVALNVVFPSGRVQCLVDDREVRIGKESFHLSELRRLSPGRESTTAVTRDGREVSGVLTGLGAVRGDLGGSTTTVDLDKATRVVVEDAETPVDEVGYTIVVRQGETVVNQASGTIRITGRPGSPPAARVPQVGAPALASQKTVVPLPAGIEQVVVGGGGRYLILDLRRLNKLAVFDVTAAKVIHYLPAPAGNFLYAAGADKLVVILPDKKLIERWSLETFEKEVSAPLPVEFALTRVAMGSQSAGPLLLSGPAGAALIDLDTLKKMSIVLDREIYAEVALHVMQIEAAPDGSAFTRWWRRQHTEEPSRFGLLRWAVSGTIDRSGLSMLSPCLASIDGGPVFTCDGNVYTADLKPIPVPAFKGAALLPVQNSYVVVARWEGAERKARLAVHFMADFKEAFAFDGVDELDGLVTDRTDPAAFTYDKRIQFVPSADVLVTIPATNDRIVVHQVDVEAALKKCPMDYLFVTSVPVRAARKGTAYSYPIAVKAKRDRVAFDLDSGPPGMSLSRTGQLTWEVPADFADAEAPVIVSITDGAGQKIFHSFTIRCR
jgi:serine protease Do